MFGKILADDQNVVEVHEHEGKMAEEFVHKTLKCLCRIFRPKGIKMYSNNPNGVQIAVFGMSFSTIGTW